MTMQLQARHLSRRPRQRRQGITLIEILVGLGIIAILMAVAAPSMTDLLERRRVIAAADEVAGLLTYAKAETNAINSQLFVRFDPDPNRSMSCAAVVTQALTNRCRCYYSPTNICPNSTSRLLRLFQLPWEHVRFTAQSSAWNGPTNVIVFSRDQLTIAATEFQVNVVGLRKGYALRVEVNPAGRVKICAPSGNMSGYAACA